MGKVVGATFLCLVSFSLIRAQQSQTKPLQDEEQCNLPPEWVTEIQSYQPVADRIINEVLEGSFKGRAFNEVALFVDKHWNRLTGTPGLEASIDYMMNKMSNYGLVNVRGEVVSVPRWIRGEEKAVLVQPTVKSLDILGLGPSVGTPGSGLSGEVIVVRSFDELDANKDLVNGKIVVYNQGWTTYGETAQYRRNGPARAGEYGAIACLLESIAPMSLDTPHTGHTVYGNGTRIPAACVTKEDAEMLYRMYSRGERLVMNLTMLDEELAGTFSRNAMGEIVGSQLPQEIVAVSGHIDAWDVGQGALDDAGGVVISVEALALIKHLGLTPRRTMQAILWTAEEFGLLGAAQFVNAHRGDMIRYKAAFESDGGTFRPLGLDFAGTPEAGCVIMEILKLTSAMNTTTYQRHPSVSTDISHMIAEGVPGLSLKNQDDNYFYYHHSPADMASMLDTTELDMNTALWTVASYVLADLSFTLPRDTGAVLAQEQE